VASRPIEELLQ